MGIFDLPVLCHDHFGHSAFNPSLVSMSTAVTFKSTCSSINSLGCLFEVQLQSQHMPLTDIANNRIFDVWV